MGSTATFRQGDLVQVRNIPDWLLSDLPSDDQSRLREQQGQVVKVLDVHPNGYLWLSLADGSAGFSVHVSDVAPVKDDNT